MPRSGGSHRARVQILWLEDDHSGTLNMALNFTSAHSSRIQKPTKKSRPVSSGINISSRGSTKRRQSTSDDVVDELRLPDTGIPLALIPDRCFDDVVEAIHFIRSCMFDDIPERASGLNSTRTATVLNFRVALPPVVSAAHVHILFNAPSKTEKEISRLIQDCVMRRVVVPGRRGKGVGNGQMLILLEDWQRTVNRTSSLSDQVKGRISYLTSTQSYSISISQELIVTCFELIPDPSTLLHCGRHYPPRK